MRAIKFLPSASAIVSIMMGIIVLIGWTQGIFLLKSFNLGPSVKVNTALSFILAGLSLAFLKNEIGNPSKRLIGQFCAMTTSLIGGSTFSEYVFNVDFGIDQLFYLEKMKAYSVPGSGRMSPLSAINFILIGLTLITISRKTIYSYLQSNILIFTIALISFVGPLGYFYDIPEMEGALYYAKMTIPASLVFFILCLGIFFSRPTNPASVMLLGRTPGGRILRWMMLSALFYLILAYVLHFLKIREKILSDELSTILFVVVSIIIFSIALWRIVIFIDQKEVQRNFLEDTLKQENLRKQSEVLRREVLNNSLDAFIGMDQNGLIFEWNYQAEIIFERKKEDTIGLRLADVIIPSRLRAAHQKGIELFLETGIGPILNKRIELSALHKDGSEFPTELTVTPVKLNGIYMFFAFVRDISKSKAAEAERESLLAQEKSARKAAELAVAARDEFLLVASHELKTPLTSLMLQAHMVAKYFTNIKKEIPENEKALIHFSALQIQINRLSMLINKVLDISRVAEGKLNLEITELDLSALVRETVAFLQEELKKTGYHLEVHADRPVWGFWDRIRIQQVITNFLTNAIKYGNGKPIFMEVKSEKEKAILIIEDHGIGIAKEDQSQLFDKFKRFVSSDYYAGMGLGLYVSLQIIKAHGGSIKVDSELGHGTTFTVEMPLRPPNKNDVS